MINPKVSIIVPIYNVEKYLSRCMDSLINQTFNEIEIIAINDGSTDNSFEILNKYIKSDERIRVIYCENSGVSHARNIGIKESKGEFIVFVDSDDWIDKDMIEIMYSNIEIESADLVMCTYVREFRDHSKEKVFNLPDVNVYESEEFKSELLRKLIGPIGKELTNPEYLDALGTAWAKLYRASMLKENDLGFIDLSIIGSGEDTLFNIYVFNKVRKAVLINKPMYHYWRDNSNSITSRYIENFKSKRKTYFKHIRSFIENNELKGDFERALDNRICISVLGMGLIECSKGNVVSQLKKIKNIRGILEEAYIESAYKNLSLKDFQVHWKVFYFFNKYKLSIPSYLMINTIELLRKSI